MTKRAAAFTLALVMMTCSITGCKSTSSAEQEIKLPIYGAEEISYEVATAQIMDISETESMGATIGYPYAQNLYYPAGAQMIAFNAVKGRKVAQGDILAELDSADLDYEINNQQTVVNTAYASAYSSESARLKYEIEKSKLDMMLAEKEKYIIRAPYDGIITYINRSRAGDQVNGGDVCCTIAEEDKVAIYIDGNDANSFRFGQKVVVKIDGTEYDATCVMAPDIAPATASGSAARRAVFQLGEGVMEKIREENALAISAGWATIYATTEKKNVLAVPDTAVKTVGSSSSVTLVDGEERFRFSVTIGESLGGYTEILNGIAEGDLVIADGSGTFTSDLKEEENNNDWGGDWNGEWDGERPER